MPDVPAAGIARRLANRAIRKRKAGWWVNTDQPGQPSTLWEC